MQEQARIMEEFYKYIDDSKVKEEVLAIIADVDAVQAKIDALEAKILEVDNNDYAGQLQEAGVPSYSPIFTGNLSCKKQVKEYAQLKEKIKAIYNKMYLK